MAWLEPRIRVAAELGPAVWALVAAERAGTGRRFVAARVLAAAAASRVDDIRALRRAAKLPMRTSVIVWPQAGDAGVVPVGERDAGEVALPPAKVLRERVSGLVRAGSLVSEVLLPHETLPALVALRGVADAGVVLAQPGLTCVAHVQGSRVRARYVLSPASATASFDTEAARLAARYQHVAALAPHLRDVGGADAPRVFVCGGLAGLRGAMVPLVEELDREIDVLDGDLPSPGAPESDLPDDGDELAALQAAWAWVSRNDRGTDRVS
jgi:hypothetical protein